MVTAPLGVAGCGSDDTKSRSREAGPGLEWSRGDYRSLPRDVCGQFAHLASNLVPNDRDPSLSSRDRRAVCHWRSTLSKKHFRALDLRVEVNGPVFAGAGETIPAVDVTRRSFKQAVDYFRRGGAALGERVEEVRTLSGLGDEATLMYGLAGEGAFAVTYMALRIRNVQVDITAQGSNTRYAKASDGSGSKGLTTPLRKKVVNHVAMAAARHLVTIVQRQRPIP
jgi:hypothetical protein